MKLRPKKGTRSFAANGGNIRKSESPKDDSAIVQIGGELTQEEKDYALKLDKAIAQNIEKEVEDVTTLEQDHARVEIEDEQLGE